MRIARFGAHTPNPYTEINAVYSNNSIHCFFVCALILMLLQLLLVDKKIDNARDLITILEDVITGGYPILIVVEDIE